MLSKIKRILWGDLTTEEFKRFGLLSLTLLFIIGTYWLMRPLKDGLFINIVGKNYLPFAKILSLGLIIPLVLIYAKLVDLVEKQKLFYILCGFYAGVFLVIAFLLGHPTIGLANTIPNPSRFLGWAIYLSVESFGSLLISLFWSFVASNTDTASAKRGYGFIIFGAQIGSMAGPSLAIHANYFGMSLLTSFVAIGLIIAPLLIKLFIIKYPAAGETHAQAAAKKKTSPIEGLKLLLTKPYLLGVLGISTLYEVVGTVLDVQLKFLAADAFPGNAENVTSFLGMFGLATNATTFVLALIGTSYFIRTFGLTFCLVTYPVCVSFAVFAVWWFPQIWVLFVAMVVVKAISYALNNPCKEIMYIPTSKDVKFKAKSVIDMFGSRSAKASGSAIIGVATRTAAPILYSSVISLAIIGVWITAALYVGKANKKLIDTGTIIE